MTNSGFVRKVAQQLERFPRVYRFLTKLSGLRSFNVKKISYKNNNALTKRNKINHKKYKIIFDGQCFQTLTRQRGIGKYSLSLISAICRERSDQEFAVILTNIASEEDIEFGKNIIENLDLTNLEILVVDLFKDRKMISFAQAEKEIQGFVQEINPEIFLTLSEFENPRHTIKILNSPNSLNVGILYD
jgi:hypothetical protein